MTLTLDVEFPADLDRFRLPAAVAARLQCLLDRQDSDQPLTPQERVGPEKGDTVNNRGEQSIAPDGAGLSGFGEYNGSAGPPRR